MLISILSIHVIFFRAFFLRVCDTCPLRSGAVSILLSIRTTGDNVYDCYSHWKTTHVSLRGGGRPEALHDQGILKAYNSMLEQRTAGWCLNAVDWEDSCRAVKRWLWLSLFSSQTVDLRYHEMSLFFALLSHYLLYYQCNKVCQQCICVSVNE